MKNRLYISLLCFTLMFGCKEDRPELGAPGSKLDGIHATWELVKMDQIDIATIDQLSLDVTDAFLAGKSYKVNFNSVEFTYSVTTDGVPNYIGSEGTWAFDDNEFPTMITLTTSLGEEIELKMNRTIRPIDPNLMFQVKRTCGAGEDPYIAYDYTFIRTNE